MTAETNGPGREPIMDRDTPLPEVWVVWGKDGVDFVAPLDFMAQEHANEHAELFPEAGPWRVHKYTLAAPPAAPLPAADADARDIRAAIACLRREGFPGLAAAIEQQARELADMTIRAECAEMVCRDKDADWVTENARAKSAEADLAAARACIAAADAMRERMKSMGEFKSASTYDAARAAIPSSAPGRETE